MIAYEYDENGNVLSMHSTAFGTVYDVSYSYSRGKIAQRDIFENGIHIVTEKYSYRNSDDRLARIDFEFFVPGLGKTWIDYSYTSVVCFK